jgi:ribosomal protein S18 acetylase RimI-like enzyme
MLDLFVAAFANDPFYRWMQPDDDAWPTFARAWFGFATDVFLRADMSTITDHAVAIWIPPGVEPLTADDVARGRAVLDEHLGPRADEVFAGIMATRGHEPAEPHTSLQYIAVAPSHQGLGLGGQLLRQVLDDLEGPAYLVSTNPANESFYKRHGFEVTATLSQSNVPTSHAMVRPAD